MSVRRLKDRLCLHFALSFLKIYETTFDLLAQSMLNKIYSNSGRNMMQTSTPFYRSRLILPLAAVVLAACATQPDPEPIPEPVVETMPEPAPVEERPAQPEVLAPSAPPTTMLAPNQPLPGTLDDFAYSTGGDPRVYFAYDQFTLSPEARQTLRQQAEWLNRYRGYTAVVEGHADERGTRQYNIALGARRANSVKAFLVSQGVDPSRLTTVSYGKERPIDARSNEAGWARNRNGHTNLRTPSQS